MSDSKNYGQDNTPFFILGCVRSGTTMLRDLLRKHPRLECPEETHFFRWAEPFGSPTFINKYRSKLLRKHRELDGVNEFDFFATLKFALSRKNLSDIYGNLYLEQKGCVDGRWFDKTPQNVYGALLLTASYPDAKFIHIYRNPLNVVASLMEGKVMPKHGLAGAVSYWNESMMILQEFKKLYPEKLLEIKYEDLTSDPMPHLSGMLEFLSEDSSLLEDLSHVTHPEKNKYKKKLTAEQIEVIIELTEPWFSQYGYSV